LNRPGIPGDFNSGKADSATRIVIWPMQFMQRLAALVQHPRPHLIRFHGVRAPHAKLRVQVVPSVPVILPQTRDHHTPAAHPEAPTRSKFLRPPSS